MKKDLDLKMISKTITDQAKLNITKTLDSNSTPDLYWSLEKAIFDALTYVEKYVKAHEKQKVLSMIEEFDNDNGTTRQ